MRVLFVVAMLTLIVASPVLGEGNFDEWVRGLKAEAMEQGISSSLVDQAFEGVAPIPRVLELDRKQPESRMTFVEYRQMIVSAQRIAKGREMMAEHRDLLHQVGQRYGVQPRFIVALWGIETFYGKNSGGYRIVDALATLAFDGRRSQYFRTELLNALRILQDGHTSLDTMKSSWAGAMGQCQFMPSSFLQLAVDFDGDGRKDIWNTQADVFASAANYLSQSGWRGNQIWGRQVVLPNGFDLKEVTLKSRKPLQVWQHLGIRKPDGSNLPIAPLKASMVMPDGEGGPAYLVYDNYRVIMKWNRSTYFATSVGLLADALAE
ncbi:MAG: lytic murein transglycosylase [Nitrospirota bacterium]|nr:lytic murein transglycosylase [Nitrospirota bacterium]